MARCPPSLRARLCLQLPMKALTSATEKQGRLDTSCSFNKRLQFAKCIHLNGLASQNKVQAPGVRASENWLLISLSNCYPWAKLFPHSWPLLVFLFVT